jgi:hypothetical protein
MAAATSQSRARRTAIVLSAAQAVLGSAGPVCFALGALAGYFMLGADKSLATAPLTGYSVGLALGALPAAWTIRQLGHRAFPIEFLAVRLRPCDSRLRQCLRAAVPLRRRRQRSA